MMAMGSLTILYIVCKPEHLSRMIIYMYLSEGHQKELGWITDKHMAEIQICGIQCQL